MIIKNNLASAPLVNYALFFVGCVILAAITASFAVWNGFSLAQWKGENDNLKAKIVQQRAQTAEFQRQSNDLQKKINALKTPAYISETEFFNQAIKRRVFSWTELLDEFERLLPKNVRMISVSPSIHDEAIGIKLEVSAKSLDDIVELIASFQSSPNFSNVVFRSEQDQDDGQLGASVSMDYFPGGIKPTLQRRSTIAPTPSADVEKPAAQQKSLREEELE